MMPVRPWGGRNPLSCSGWSSLRAAAGSGALQGLSWEAAGTCPAFISPLGSLTLQWAWLGGSELRLQKLPPGTQLGGGRCPCQAELSARHRERAHLRGRPRSSLPVGVLGCWPPRAEGAECGVRASMGASP